MSDYTRINDFSAKDALPTGNAAKAIKGSDVDAEFDAIVTHSATKTSKEENETVTGSWDFTTAPTVNGAPVCVIETGTYTGNGGTSQVISLTNPAIDPLYVKVWPEDTGDGNAYDIYETTDTLVSLVAAGVAVEHADTGPHRTRRNAIIAVATGSFTVDDRGSNEHPNTNSTTYHYLVMGTA